MKKAAVVIAFLLLPALAWHGCAGDGSLIDEMMELDPCEGVVGPTLAMIQLNTFDQTCGITPCHVPGGIGPMPLDSEEASFANLVDVDSVELLELKRVEPGNPDDSYLIWKLLGQDPQGQGQIVGERMPFGGAMLPAEEIDDIALWILNGACP